MLSSALFKGIFLLLILIAGGVATVWGYKLLVKEKAGPSEEELRLEALNALYAQEAFPMPELADADPFNYGLEDASSTASGISGHVIFTGRHTGSDLPNQVYSLDVSQSDPAPKKLMPDYIQYSAFMEVVDRMFPNEFFVDSLHYSFSQISENKKDESHSIQRYNFNDGSLKGYDSISGDYVQNIAWATGNTRWLAYSRTIERPTDYVDLLSIDNWEVVIVDLVNDEVVNVLKGATQPKWSPDGSKLVVLRSDGLYVYGVGAETGVKFLGAEEGKFLTTSMLDISPDGKYMIWSVGKAGLITVHEISSWDSGGYEIGRIQEDDTEYYWPQFSPDSQYYVVQAIDAPKAGSMTRENPRLEIRSVRDRTILKTYPMDDFDFNSLFIDTWIEQIAPSVPN